MTEGTLTGTIEGMRTTSKALSATLSRTSGIAATLAVVGLVGAACSSDTDDAVSEATSAAASAIDAEDADDAADTDTDDAAQDGSDDGGEYRNGEYTATGGYTSPGGPQSVGVTVTLSNDVITALNVDISHTKGTSKDFQEKFVSGIDEIVVGKNIDDLDVSKVAGSSLTSGGFNEAIAEIKNEARD